MKSKKGISYNYLKYLNACEEGNKINYYVEYWAASCCPSNTFLNFAYYWSKLKTRNPKTPPFHNNFIFISISTPLVFSSRALAGDQSSRSFTTASNSAGGGRQSRVAHQLILSLIISHLDLAHAEAIHVCNKEFASST